MGTLVSKLRYFTREEAESLIPQMTAVFHSAMETKGKIEAKIEVWRKEHKSMSAADEAVLRGHVDFLATELETKLGQIVELGATPKDLELGLVDFPARIDGQEGYLCWKLGEEKINYWHKLTEGFQGRKSLETDKNKHEQPH